VGREGGNQEEAERDEGADAEHRHGYGQAGEHVEEDISEDDLLSQYERQLTVEGDEEQLVVEESEHCQDERQWRGKPQLNTLGLVFSGIVLEEP
jgi:hypothetical protein